MFHNKTIKLSYCKLTTVKKLNNNDKHGKPLPRLTIADCSKLASACTISLVVCIKEVSGPHNRPAEGGETAVSNLHVAFADRKIETACWGAQACECDGPIQDRRCVSARLDDTCAARAEPLQIGVQHRHCSATKSTEPKQRMPVMM